MAVNSTIGDLGDLSLPLVAADVETTLSPLDPARSRVLALFKTAINYELAEVWNKITATLPATHALSGKLPVADSLEMAPSSWALQQRKTDFPLLCLFRFGGATWAEHTLEVDRRDQNWRLVYILPPLDLGDLHKFDGVATAIPAIIRRVIRERGHKEFQSGALQFFSGVGGLGVMRLVGDEFAPAQFSEGDDAPIYFSVTMTLASSEYATDNPDEFADIEGVDFSIGVGDSTGTIPDLISAYSDVDPL